MYDEKRSSFKTAIVLPERCSNIVEVELPARKKSSEKDPSIHFCLLQRKTQFEEMKENMCTTFYVGSGNSPAPTVE